jgi:membrane protease YdiL (CAAX protease family)
MLGLVRRVWSAWFGETFERVEADAERFRTSDAGRQPDAKTVWVLLTTAVALTFQTYTSRPGPLMPFARWLDRLTGSSLADFLIRVDGDEFSALAWWVAAMVFWYVVPAVVVIKLVLRERLTDYGVKLAGWTAGWKIYLVFVAVMVPLVVVMSADEHFQNTYPFYAVADRSEVTWRLPAWEVLYAAQFLALEFFFRGFLLHGVKHRFGVYSAFVMTVPYCMIHFRKPFPECVASIIAGVMLGYMSLKTRSVWLGAALHVSVAWGMDACSLTRRGLIG